ncbi:MAG TPA: hypothetical protein VJQ58_07895 [Burkholderiales bacterium]|nr:hypothetical protein [Burkholderiales bacterium]
MRLDGIGLFLALALAVAYGVIVDIALLARLFRHRAALIGGLIVALAMVALVGVMVASPNERAGFFGGAPGGASLVILLATGAVFFPFMVIAPLAQYLAAGQGGRTPGWVFAWMALQPALLPAFFVLANSEEHFWKQEYAAAQAVGRDTRAGAFGVIGASADRHHERIWGTGWSYPWRLQPPGGYLPRRSGWIAGLARGVDASAPIAANEPLSEPDRAMLRTLVERHFTGYAIPNIEAKLIWDALEPGNFSRQLAPRGLSEPGVVSEEVIPQLLVRLEQQGELRVCPGGHMMDADRAVLNKIVLAKVRDYDEARQREARAAAASKEVEREMSEAPAPYRFMWKAANALGKASGAQDVKAPDWSGYPQRVEQLCRGPK